MVISFLDTEFLKSLIGNNYHCYYLLSVIAVRYSVPRYSYAVKTKIRAENLVKYIEVAILTIQFKTESFN